MNDPSPHSPDLLMDSLPGKAEAAPYPFNLYTPMSSQGIGGRVSFDTPMANPGQIPSLDQFRNHRDEPWNPLQATQGSSMDLGGRGLASIYNTTSYQNFGTYRTTTFTHSESGTIGPSAPKVASDSGYGGSGTLYADQDTAETRSLIQRLDRQKLTPGSISNFPIEEGSPKRPASSHRGGSTSSHARIPCPDTSCVFVAKTNSELKKHIARHEKPYKCDISGCNRKTEGFSTSNDLDRHKRCVHEIYSSDKTVYRCIHDSCKDKHKNWPRQDNFRQHLKRIHRIDDAGDLRDYVYRAASADDVRSNAMSEYAPSETTSRSNADPRLPWAGMGQGFNGSQSSPGGAAGTARMAHAATLPSYSPQSPFIGQGDYSAFGDHSDYQSQNQSHLDSSQISETLAGLEYHPETQPLPRDAPMDSQTYIEPNILSHTGLNFSMDERSSMQTNPRIPVIQLEDESPIHSEEADDLMQHHKTEPETPKNPQDEMVLDEPVQSQDSEEESEAEDPPDTGDSTMSEIGQTKVLVSPPESIPADTNSFSAPDASSSTNEAKRRTRDSIDLDDKEMSVLVALRALNDKSAIDKILMKLGWYETAKVGQSSEAAKQRQQDEIKDLSHVREPKEVSLPEPSATLSVADDPSSSPSSFKGHKCEDPNCKKVFNRPCELKKHQRRHEKPYACTFNNCDKRFGSKNDWKRHENSQHSQMEIWRCVEPALILEPTLNQDECGKVYQRRESLRIHFERDHKIEDTATIEKKLNDCRHGRNFETRFWCGFCVKTIEPQGHGGPAHSERFDHIDDHFMGRNGLQKADISRWKGLESDEEMVKRKEVEPEVEVVKVVKVGGENTKKRGLMEDGGADGGEGSASGNVAKRNKRPKKEERWSCVSF